MEFFNIFEDYKFRDGNQLKEALTHKSFASKTSPHNEKLEFLGDAVLNLAISHILIETYPRLEEGDLTKLRGGLVSGDTLGNLAENLGFQKHLKVGKGLSPKNRRLLAEALEAYLGAVYLDSHFEKVKDIVNQIFQEKIQNKDVSTDYKSHLQEWCQKKYKKNPHYVLKKEEGSEHKKIFYMEVRLDEEILGTGHDYRKKQAEQLAAQSACKSLNIEIATLEDN